MKVLLVSLVLLASSGCSGMLYELKINALSLPESASKKAYVLIPGNRSVQGSDLQYLEFAQLTKHAFKQRGFQLKRGPQEAEIVVLLAYGIGEPEEHEYVKQVPVWGATGFTTSSVSSAGGSRTKTTVTPTIGIVGTREVVEVDIEYTRYLLLVAYDLRALRQGRKRQLWKTAVASTGAGNDLRKVFPYLIFGAMPYLGKRTDHRTVVDVDEDEEKVKRFVRNALRSPLHRP